MGSDSEACEVVVTRGGARAMLDRSTGEVMHPVVGPLVEAELLYVAPSRLRHRLSLPEAKSLVLYDVGLGAGTNAALAWKTSQEEASTRPLSIVSFETSLSAFELALQEEHRAAFGLEGPIVEAARHLLLDGEHHTARTVWRLVVGDLLRTLPEQAPHSADVIFWDPFSPRANPALWTVATFSHLRRACRAGASVHTYSGSTAVRSALLLAGFAVGRGPSTGEKSQTTVAALDFRDLEEPLDQRWLERLGRSSAAWPVDAPADAMERVCALPQFNREGVRTSP